MNSEHSSAYISSGSFQIAESPIMKKKYVPKKTKASFKMRAQSVSSQMVQDQGRSTAYLTSNDLETKKKVRAQHFNAMKKYQVQLRQIYKDKDLIMQQIELLDHEIQEAQQNLKDNIDILCREAFFEIGKLSKKILEIQEVKSILVVYCECLSVAKETEAFTMSIFYKPKKNESDKFDEVKDLMSELSANKEQQIKLFISLSLKQWDKLLEIWKQKPVLEQLMKTSSKNSGKPLFSDTFRGLKIICSWICSLIEIHFKLQAHQLVQNRLVKLEDQREKLDSEYNQRMQEIKEINDQLKKKEDLLRTDIIQKNSRSHIFKFKASSVSNSSYQLNGSQNRCASVELQQSSTGLSSKFEKSIGEQDLKQLKALMESKDNRLLIPFTQALKPTPSTSCQSAVFYDNLSSSDRLNSEASSQNDMMPSFLRKARNKGVLEQPMHEEKQVSRQEIQKLPYEIEKLEYDQFYPQRNENFNNDESTLDQQKILDALNDIEHEHEHISNYIKSKQESSHGQNYTATDNSDVNINEISFYDVDLRQNLNKELENFVNTKLEKLNRITAHKQKLVPKKAKANAPIVKFLCF